jgi:hypothetical protein
MLKVFEDKERLYQSALKNWAEYVYNDVGGHMPQQKKLHFADCRALYRSEDHKTAVPKVCSDSLDQMLNWLNRNRGHRGAGFTFCRLCFV